MPPVIETDQTGISLMRHNIRPSVVDSVLHANQI